MTRSAADRLVVAFDYPRADEALALADRLAGRIRWAKVGLELFVTAGPNVVHAFAARGFHVFLDLKFHDIPHTVAGACAAAARSGAAMINVHAGGAGEMMRAALEGARRGAAESRHPAPKLLAVTVLTSLSGSELAGYYSDRPVEDKVVMLARAAREAGLDGVVCSPREIEPLRAALGPDFGLLTPGVRFADGDIGDQKRVATPADAARAGADWIVMGRPITAAPDPVAAAARAVVEIDHGLSGAGNGSTR